MSSFVPKAAIGLAACAAMAVSIGIVCPAKAVRAAEPVVEYRDVGGPLDFDKKQNIYFDRGDAFGGTGEPVYWSLDWDSGTQGTLYENGGHFWWVFAPPKDAKNVIGSRAIKAHHFGRFRVKADKLPKEGEVFLTLRVKDEILVPAPVFVWSGGQKWTQIGTIGGKNDHWWKTSQFRVPAADRRIDQGTLVFKVGVGRYDPSLQGEVNIDQIQVATTDDRSRFPADQRGSGRWSRRAGSPTWAGPWKSFPARGPSSCTASGAAPGSLTAAPRPRPATARWIAGDYSRRPA